MSHDGSAVLNANLDLRIQFSVWVASPLGLALHTLPSPSLVAMGKPSGKAKGMAKGKAKSSAKPKEAHKDKKATHKDKKEIIKDKKEIIKGKDNAKVKPIKPDQEALTQAQKAKNGKGKGWDDITEDGMGKLGNMAVLDRLKQLANKDPQKDEDNVVPEGWRHDRSLQELEGPRDNELCHAAQGGQGCLLHDREGNPPS